MVTQQGANIILVKIKLLNPHENKKNLPPFTFESHFPGLFMNAPLVHIIPKQNKIVFKIK